MKYFEFGKENKELMVLLHGGGTSYLGILPTAKKIAETYHVILVAYDGFNPSEPETEFQSVAYEYAPPRSQKVTISTTYQRILVISRNFALLIFELMFVHMFRQP